MGTLRSLPAFFLMVIVFNLCACNKAASDSPLPRADQLQVVTLNADDYRQVITDIDRAVFDAQPFDDTRRELLTTNLEKLAQRVKSASDFRFLQIEASEIMTLAKGSRKMPEEALRAQLPNQWMRIRNNLFEDRSWFARSAADLDQPSKTAP